jgi:HK97 gp10 family phage protein
MGTQLVVVYNGIPAVIVRTNARVKALTDQVREATLSAARDNAPVDTGKLRDSGHIEGEEVIFDATNAQGQPYGFHVEYGTRHAPAQPFLTPAAEQVKPLLFGGMAKVID